MILKFLENLAVEDHPAPSYQLQLNQSLFNNEFSFENCGRTNFYYFLKFSTTKILKFGFPTFTQSIYQTIYCCLAWPNYQNGPNIRIHVPKCGLLTNCIQNWGQNDSLMGESLWQKDRMVTYILFDLCLFNRVSVQGVESLWGDCRFIPADWGSQQQICAILLFLKTFHYKNDKKCKSISIFFLKNNNKFFFFYFIKFKPPA